MFFGLRLSSIKVHLDLEAWHHVVVLHVPTGIGLLCTADSSNKGRPVVIHRDHHTCNKVHHEVAFHRHRWAEAHRNMVRHRVLLRTSIRRSLARAAGHRIRVVHRMDHHTVDHSHRCPVVMDHRHTLGKFKVADHPVAEVNGRRARADHTNPTGRCHSSRFTISIRNSVKSSSRKSWHAIEPSVVQRLQGKPRLLI